MDVLTGDFQSSTDKYPLFTENNIWIGDIALFSCHIFSSHNHFVDKYFIKHNRYEC